MELSLLAKNLDPVGGVQFDRLHCTNCILLYGTSWSSESESIRVHVQRIVPMPAMPAMGYTTVHSNKEISEFKKCQKYNKKNRDYQAGGEMTDQVEVDYTTYQAGGEMTDQVEVGFIRHMINATLCDSYKNFLQLSPSIR